MWVTADYFWLLDQTHSCVQSRARLQHIFSLFSNCSEIRWDTFLPMIDSEPVHLNEKSGMVEDLNS
jgi:hypothetical protein